MRRRLLNQHVAVIRWLVVASLWHAPLPVLHAHGTLADAPATSPNWLAEHLERRHATVDPFCSLCLGWHVHFEVPGTEEDPQDAPSLATSLPVGNSQSGICQLRETLAGSTPMWGMTVTAWDSVPQPVLHGRTVRRRQFLSRCAERLPLPLRVGVMRC